MDEKVIPFDQIGRIGLAPTRTASQDLAAIEYWHMKFADIRAQLTKIDDELTRQRHLLERILKLVEKFR